MNALVALAVVVADFVTHLVEGGRNRASFAQDPSRFPWTWDAARRVAPNSTQSDPTQIWDRAA